MRFLGAKFPNRPAALHALEHVRSRFGSDDAVVAPLADFEPSSTVLATAVDDRRSEEAIAMLEGDGGEIVSDISDGA